MGTVTLRECFSHAYRPLAAVPFSRVSSAPFTFGTSRSQFRSEDTRPPCNGHLIVGQFEMLKALLHRIGLATARYLMHEVEISPLTPPTDFTVLARTLLPGDVLLIETFTRVSGPIKYLTQSTWSHAALFVGPLAHRHEPEGEPHVLIEAELESGVCSSPLSKYRDAHTRICRPVNLSNEDLSVLIAFVVERIGYTYDLHNVFDLVRYLLPLPIPGRLRRRFISVGAGAPTRAICSTLIAQAFQTIHYPILPIIETLDAGTGTQPRRGHAQREIMHIRNSSLYVPRDFDISPYFDVIKPTIAHGFDYHKLSWI